MRYWIKYDGSDYSPSTDDMSYYGYAEITQRPENYVSVWEWSFEENAWVLNKKRYLEQLAVNRYQNEIKGVTLNGIQYDTDDRARMAMIAILTYAPATTVFKLADGTYQDMTLAEVKALFDHVMEYTLACYAHERDIKEFVSENAHDITMLDNDWPSNILGETTPPVETPPETEAEPTN